MDIFLYKRIIQGKITRYFCKLFLWIQNFFSLFFFLLDIQIVNDLPSWIFFQTIHSFCLFVLLIEVKSHFIIFFLMMLALNLFVRKYHMQKKHILHKISFLYFITFEHQKYFSIKNYLCLLLSKNSLNRFCLEC